VDVLVIDDDAPIRELLAATLRRHGYTVCLAADGRGAGPLLARYHFRLLVTDIFMPYMDGIEVIMQARRRHPELPVLAMSGGGISGGPDRTLLPARYLGCRRTLEKPFDLGEFLSAVRELLGRR
jgi:DNA-binding response OmpR family regulator